MGSTLIFLLVWRNHHTAFFKEGNTIFHAHGEQGTPTGFTHDLSWWLNKYKIPLVFRQLFK